VVQCFTSITNFKYKRSCLTWLKLTLNSRKMTFKKISGWYWLWKRKQFHPEIFKTVNFLAYILHQNSLSTEIWEAVVHMIPADGIESHDWEGDVLLLQALDRHESPSIVPPVPSRRQASHQPAENSHRDSDLHLIISMQFQLRCPQLCACHILFLW
jgi:hypothetical protein